MDNKKQYIASGRLVKVDETKHVSDKFKKRDFVVEIPDGRFPQFVTFQVTGDRCSALDGATPGQEVEVHFNLRGRAWNDKFFNSLEAWRINLGASVASGCDTGAPADDDIPF